MTGVNRHRTRRGAFLLVALASMAPGGAAFAQRHPFPQNGGYPHGFVPTSVTANDAVSSYNNWKAKYLKSDCGNGYYRVDFNAPKGTTVSEGMGYGMVISVYFGDKTAFDGLWKFVQKNLNTDGLMGWNVTCHGFNQNSGGPEGSATDGDADIGFALVAAVDQWGEAYRQTALTYLETLKKVDFESCPDTHRNMAKAGNWGGGCEFSNSSYWMPAYYRVFSEFTGDPFWGAAADDAIDIYLLNRNKTTGLAANEVDEHGKTHDNQNYVDYNGCRTPWRFATDYLWYGTAGSRDITDKLTGWVQGFGITALFDGYNTDGTRTASAKYVQQNPWVGGFACGAMSKSQGAVNAFAGDFRSIADDEGGYYGSSLRTLYMLLLSGNFWKPGPPAPGVAPAPDRLGAAVASADASPKLDIPPPPPPPPAPTAAPAASAPAPTPRGCGGCQTPSAEGGPGAAAAILTAVAAFCARRRRTRA